MILLPDTIYLNRVAENEGSIAPVEYNIYYKIFNFWINKFNFRTYQHSSRIFYRTHQTFFFIFVQNYATINHL